MAFLRLLAAPDHPSGLRRYDPNYYLRYPKVLLPPPFHNGTMLTGLGIGRPDAAPSDSDRVRGSSMICRRSGGFMRFSLAAISLCSSAFLAGCAAGGVFQDAPATALAAAAATGLGGSVHSGSKPVSGAHVLPHARGQHRLRPACGLDAHLYPDRQRRLSRRLCPH